VDGSIQTLPHPAAYYSTDGEHWSATTVSANNTTNFTLNSVTIGDGVFVAVASRAPTFYTQGGMIFSSADGILWQQRAWPTQPFPGQEFSGIAHGAGSFLAVEPTGLISQTPDVRPQLRVERAVAGQYRLLLRGYSNALYATETSADLVLWRR